MKVRILPFLTTFTQLTARLCENVDVPDKKCSTPSLDPPRSVIHVAEEVVTIANEPTPPKLLHEDPVNSQYGKNELFHCNHLSQKMPKMLRIVILFILYRSLPKLSYERYGKIAKGWERF